MIGGEILHKRLGGGCGRWERNTFFDRPAAFGTFWGRERQAMAFGKTAIGLTVFFFLLEFFGARPESESDTHLFDRTDTN